MELRKIIPLFLPLNASDYDCFSRPHFLKKRAPRTGYFTASLSARVGYFQYKQSYKCHRRLFRANYLPLFP